MPVEEGGRRVWRDMEEFDTADRAHANWPPRFFALITDTYLATTGNRGARVGDAMCYLLSARGLLDFALPVMRAVAADARAADGLGELPPAGAG